MKRISVLSVVLSGIVLLTAVLSGCGAKESDDLLINAGLDSAALMKEAVCSETYRAIMSASAAVNDPEMISIVSNECVDKYKAVYEVTFDPEKAVASVSERFEDYEKLSDNLQKRVIAMVYGSIPSMINSNSGTSAMAFAAMFNDGGSIKCQMVKEKRILIFVFENGYPIWITYSSSGEGTVSYNSNWIIADCTQIDSEESLIRELHIENIPTLEVKEIK